ncbi:MAG: four helix bundle protein [Bacteroidia bacterium]|nr:four helix bundle protein [Bacteroidia bacterium]
MNNKVEKLEDLKAWFESKLLAVNIYKITSSDKWMRDYNLRDQIRRASVSVPSNIAEGYGRSSNKEFIRFLYISKGSLYELKTQLLIANEIGYISTQNWKGS